MRWYTYILILLFTSCTQLSKKQISEEKLINYVNPFIGTDGPGNTYPGATVPFGMVQLSPDIGIPGWDRIAGYYYQDSIISGFSHTHLSGTGAGDLYDILVMPTNSRFSKKIKENNYKPFSSFSHDQEGASPGYYWVNLLDYGIKAEMTATARVGVHRYTFPEDNDTQLHVDLGYAINWDTPTDTFIKVVNDSTLQGYRMSTGWARNQRVYFEMQFSKPFTSHEILDDKKKDAPPFNGINSKIILHYSTAKDEQIEVKTGLSSVSMEAAGKAITIEAGQNFDAIQQKAASQWEHELQKITVDTKDVNKKTIFYTMLYQSMLAPTLYSDINNEYKAANDTQGLFKKGQDTIVKTDGFLRYDTFSLWDTFRAAHPLQTIIHPEKVPDIINSLLAHYQETDILPVWSMQGSETNMMIGYHAVPVIVDAYFKGFQFDAALAYTACKESAMVNGRQIDVYKERGFIPADENHENWSVSKTMEYAFDDWCIAMFAKALGKEDDYRYFLKRSESWKNLYNEESSWIQPKDTNGEFIIPFVPKLYGPNFAESNAWQYYWFVPHDIEGLIEKTGGRERFTQKLDSMFSYAPKPSDKLPIFSTGMIGQYAHGNEPSHHVAYLYNYLGQPSKTQKLVRDILEGQYKNEPNGHCGNEDCGQMSSWYILSALGFYPVNPAQGTYDLGIPLYESALIQVGNGKTFHVIAEGGIHKRFVEKVFLNGEALSRNYITHKEISSGGTLIFKLTDNPEFADNKQLKTPEVNKIYN
ncbi:GH92 family glycosyl hydrolase [Flagellimonas sp. HMM57]|uniref:GH92 family glycosyl hydrolase n=1 Tax=unclassified Flagellimonas TaxID=2644544 RepID=UPI0013D88878|nr:MULTISPECIES: GH92 family glycosyl hydrolase [unclassified Flagellimonas]UII74761.1 GH92 family glycosyl hydrolase [Flagellimonas sp. HMM57]